MKERRIIDRVNYSYLRPQKAEMVKEFHRNNFDIKSDLQAKRYNTATILPLRTDAENRVMWGLGGVIDSQKKIHREFEDF